MPVAKHYPVARYFCGHAYELELGQNADALAQTMLEVCGRERLTSTAIAERLVECGACVAEQGAAMMHTLYRRHRLAWPRRMDDSFMEPDSGPIVYFVLAL